MFSIGWYLCLGLEDVEWFDDWKFKFNKIISYKFWKIFGKKLLLDFLIFLIVKYFYGIIFVIDLCDFVKLKVM